MPRIKIDQDIYDHLNERGKTEDTFSDVLRRELGLLSKPPLKGGPETANDALWHPLESPPPRPRTREPQLAAIGLAVNDRLRVVLNRYLPPHWSTTRERERQIVMVVEETLGQPQDLDIAERELTARKTVAGKLSITPNTVLDKYGRQLYGSGFPQVERFRAELSKIEKDYRLD